MSHREMQAAADIGLHDLGESDGYDEDEQSDRHNEGELVQSHRDESTVPDSDNVLPDIVRRKEELMSKSEL